MFAPHVAARRVSAAPRAGYYVVAAAGEEPRQVRAVRAQAACAVQCRAATRAQAAR